MRERWRIMRDLKLCYNCLNKDHIRDQCNIEKQCNLCNRRHHQILHFQPRSNDFTKSNTKNNNLLIPSTASPYSNDTNIIAHTTTNESSD